MSETSPQKLIQDLTIDFFKIINADIKQNGDIFTITSPKKYDHLFGNESFSITFSPKTTSESLCELIAPGSKLLSQIINLCKTKGPITKGILESLKNHSGSSNRKYGIRFYFYVSFEEIEHFSELEYVDLDIESSEYLDLKEKIRLESTVDIEHINFDLIPSLFLKASKKIRKNFEDTEKKFVQSSNEKKRDEIDKIQNEYDTIILEVESFIKENEKNLVTESDNHKLFDDSMEKIQNIRKEQTNLIRGVSEKYKILLSFDLIAIIIFLYYE